KELPPNELATTNTRHHIIGGKRVSGRAAEMALQAERNIRVPFQKDESKRAHRHRAIGTAKCTTTQPSSNYRLIETSPQRASRRKKMSTFRCCSRFIVSLPVSLDRFGFLSLACVLVNELRHSEC